MTRGVRNDLTRQRFGRWLVICLDDRPEGAETGSGAHARWVCRCECGEVSSVRSDALLQGRSLSCGCLAKEVAATTGEARQRARYRGEPYRRPADADELIERVRLGED